jgi:hypothetical protein
MISVGPIPSVFESAQASKAHVMCTVYGCGAWVAGLCNRAREQDGLLDADEWQTLQSAGPTSLPLTGIRGMA